VIAGIVCGSSEFFGGKFRAIVQIDKSINRLIESYTASDEEERSEGERVGLDTVRGESEVELVM
jgi:hypothetical protein